MLERRRSVISVGGPRLPYDAELEYLQSVDKQRIMLPIVCTKVDIRFQFASSNTQQRVLCARESGANTDTNNSFCIYQNGSNYLAFSMNADWKTNSINFSRRCHAVMNSSNKKTEVRYMGDGAKTITHTGFTACAYIVLFDGISVGTNASRIYTCKLYDSSGLKYDLIPVRKGAVGYLYDKVSGQLFGNEGTGSFVLGADKPTEYTPAFFGIQSDGSAFIKTGFILPQMASIRGQFSEPTLMSGNKVFFIAAKNEDGTVLRTGFLYGGATSSSTRQALVYYDANAYLNSKSGFLGTGTRLLNLWMTPYRFGTDSNSPNDQKFTKGSSYTERELHIGHTDGWNISSSITPYAGWIYLIQVYGSEAKDVTTYSGFASYSPVASFRACTLPDGTATMWYVQGNRPCTVAGGGTFTAIN